MDKSITPEQQSTLLETLKARFEKYAQRHADIKWDDVHSRIASNPNALFSLREMEATGGEPDVIGRDEKTGELTFCDCSTESPAGRRSICYDRRALDARKENKPKNDAVSMAAAMGITILTEAEYRSLQELGDFDTKTSSWIATPNEIRELGGALFCDKRYKAVFTYHNGADSYYAARGFRGLLRV